MIREMDRRGELVEPGYSTVLGWMIAGFVVTLAAALGSGVAAM